MIGIKSQIFVGIIIAIVAGSAIGLVVFNYLPAQPLQNYPAISYVQNGTTVSGGNCAQSFSNGLPISVYAQNKSIVFLMEPNSTAEICVTYNVQKVQLPSPVTFPVIGGYQYSIVEEHIQCTPNSCTGYSRPANITMSSSPSNFTIGANNSVAKIIIVYTITSGIKSQGFYALHYLNSCTTFIPFAVGYGPSQVNASDFVGFFTPNSGCGGPKYNLYQDYLSNGNISGISNLSYTYSTANFTSP